MLKTAPPVKYGDVLGFLANPRNVGHAAIMAGQKYNGGDSDGLHRIIHTEIVFSYRRSFYTAGFLLDKVFPWPVGGLKITKLEKRLEYPHGVLHGWLGHDARSKFKTRLLTNFVREVEDYHYDIPSLLRAVSRNYHGRLRPGCYFCSSFVRHAWAKSGAWNGERGLLSVAGGVPHRVEARVEPQRFSPNEIFRAPILGGWQVLKPEDFYAQTAR